MKIDPSVEATPIEQAVIDCHEVFSMTVGFKKEGKETVYRVVNVRGRADLGYIASSEEWFTAEDKYYPEFYEVEFQTPIRPSIGEALAEAMPDAIAEMTEAGFDSLLDIVRPLI